MLKLKGSMVGMSHLYLKLRRRKKKFVLALPSYFKLHKLMSTVSDNCLVKMKIALNLWVEDMKICSN